MDDCALSAGAGDAPPARLFRSALGEQWKALPPEVRAMHDGPAVERFSGVAQVSRGTSLLTRLAAWLFGFPPAGDDVPVTVTKTRNEAGEVWERDFGGWVFRSRCRPSPEPHCYRECFGPFNYEPELQVNDGAMRLPLRRGWFLGIPLPRFLMPANESREYAENGVFHFDVAIHAPLGCGLIVHYRGWLRPRPPY